MCFRSGEVPGSLASGLLLVPPVFTYGMFFSSGSRNSCVLMAPKSTVRSQRALSLSRLERARHEAAASSPNRYLTGPVSRSELDRLIFRERLAAVRCTLCWSGIGFAFAYVFYHYVPFRRLLCYYVC